MTIGNITFVAGVLAALLLPLAGVGVRLGLWTFRTGFGVMRWAGYLGLAVAAISLVQLLVAQWRSPRPWRLGVALAFGLLAAGVPWYWRQRARQVPPIHDISTDTQDPPAFVAVLPLRADAPNPATYEGAEIAAAQAQAYPDVRPLELPATPPAAAFGRALDAARAEGWAIVAADSAEGRLEATATTGWFGFKDDVVVRIRAAGAGSRIDVRSMSRVGRSDVGTNARRIREYLSRLAD
ncbi:MAG: DUF1499 domain-containing protein [Gemmatimonadales bacterium]